MAEKNPKKIELYPLGKKPTYQGFSFLPAELMDVSTDESSPTVDHSSLVVASLGSLSGSYVDVRLDSDQQSLRSRVRDNIRVIRSCMTRVSHRGFLLLMRLCVHLKIKSIHTYKETKTVLRHAYVLSKGGII